MLPGCYAVSLQVIRADRSSARPRYRPCTSYANKIYTVFIYDSQICIQSSSIMYKLS